MITKEQYIQSFIHEINVIKHLAEKITPAMLAYRPTEKQRSMLELLQYLGHIGTTGVKLSIAGSSADYQEAAKARDAVTFENFMEKMDEQAEFVKREVSALTDEQLATEAAMFGTTLPMSMHLLNILKWMTAYKMQLFLYIKATGKDDIGTSNVWGGRDLPPKV